MRDLGTEGAGFADVALRDAIAQGMIPGPRVFAATRAIVATGCYGPSGFDPRWELPKGAQVVDGPVADAQGRARADRRRRRLDQGLRRLPPPARASATPTFTQEELARRGGRGAERRAPVAAHAYTEEGIRRAVLAGVATIEHGTDVTDELLALMKQKGVALVPDPRRLRSGLPLRRLEAGRARAAARQGSPRDVRARPRSPA